MNIPRKNTRLKLTTLAAAVLALSACGGSSDPVESTNIILNIRHNRAEADFY